MQDRAPLLLSVVGGSLAAFGCHSSLVEGTTGGGASTTEVSGEDGQDGDGDGDGSAPTSGGVATTGMGVTTTGLATGETGGPGEAGETTGGETGETTGPTGDCGDGVVGEGETCDLGYLENRDDGECTKGCQWAVCGDGLVWADEEECDLGMANNDALYGGCLQSCSWGPRCNDGVLQPEEECDASAPPTEGAVECNAGNCRFQARVAFVTSGTFAADMGGLAGADAACRAAAKAGKLDNADNFLAYLGDGGGAPANRFTEGLQDKGFPYARRDGQRLADDLAGVFKYGLEVPLVITEMGTVLANTKDPQLVWTGVNFKGEPVADNCEAWSTTDFKYSGRVGKISPVSDSEADVFDWKSKGQWSNFGSRPCFTTKFVHLYCFED